MRRRLPAFLGLVWLVGGLLAAGTGPAGAQALSTQPFSGYATGSELSTNALTIGNTQVANVQEAFSAATANTAGLATGIINEMGQAVQPGLAGKNTYGRGSGVELGLINPAPQGVDVNQLKLAQMAEAAAPPPTDLIDHEIGPLPIDPILFATLAVGKAQALYDPNFCPIGVPLSFGQGELADAKLLTSTQGGVRTGLINTDTVPDGQDVAQSRSFSYLKANGDGTIGLVTEVHEILAPVTIGQAPVTGTPLLTIKVLGEIVMRTTATGKPGGAKVEYTGDPLIVITGPTGNQILSLTLQQLVGQGGLNLDVPPISPILSLHVGEPPRAIGSDNAPAPKQEDPAGTAASAAVDVLRLKVINIPGLTGLDLRLGHMETRSVVPAGGIRCQIPVNKTAVPDPVPAGSDVTIRVSIPPEGSPLKNFIGCDLVDLSATSKERVVNGNVRYTIVSADHGGVVRGDTVSWSGLSYHPGDPPLVLTYVMHIAPGSAGLLEDTASVTAHLGNCTGGAAGQDLVGGASLNNAAVSGTFTLRGPTVGAGAGELATTGGSAVVTLVGGGALLMAAAGVWALRRRSSLVE